MMTEARAGFRAFNEGPKDDREVDFVALRQALAAGEAWTDGLTERIQPRGRRAQAERGAAQGLARPERVAAAAAPRAAEGATSSTTR